MKIEVLMKDKDGNPIEIGDKVELFNWGREERSLGIVEIIWDIDEGRVSCSPTIVEDSYDFWTKALPRSRKQFERQENKTDEEYTDEEYEEYIQEAINESILQELSSGL